jgi:hypothetical protein
MEWISSKGIGYDTHSGAMKGLSKAAAKAAAMQKFGLLTL